MPNIKNFLVKIIFMPIFVEGPFWSELATIFYRGDVFYRGDCICDWFMIMIGLKM